MKKLFIGIIATIACSNYCIAQKSSFKTDLENKRIIDSIYRDSLIKVAKNYKISFLVSDDYNPDISWLHATIRQKEYDLKKGNNYNTYNMTVLSNLICEKVLPPHGYVTGGLLFKIDDDGLILNVSAYGNSNVLIQTVDAINNVVDGKKIDPYILNGKPYPSYKQFKIQYIPNTMKRFGITEVGNAYRQ